MSYVCSAWFKPQRRRHVAVRKNVTILSGSRSEFVLFLLDQCARDFLVLQTVVLGSILDVHCDLCPYI